MSMVHHSFAARLLTWRKAAAMLLACTMLCPPVSTYAQSTTQQLLPSRTTNRATLLGLGSPTIQANTPAPTDGTTPAQPQEQQATDADADAVTTATVPTPRTNPGDAILEPVDEANEPYAATENTYEPTVDGGEPTPATGPEQTPGIRLGTFTLRPSISQTVNHEKEKFTGGSRSRNYLTTGIRGTLTSDWARHSLTVTGDGAYERNFGGSEAGEEPRAKIDADLRLDLNGNTEAHLKAGYEFSREDTNDPNALTGAAVQGGEHNFTTGASIQRDFGKLRGLAELNLSRTVYTDAKGLNGQSISLSDRDRFGADLRGRVGYELSPALIPFLEVTVGGREYDEKFDSTGYKRSSRSYGAKLGTEVDLGEKFKGEAAVGYLRRTYDDNRLSAVDGLSLDGNLSWSPQRGTDVYLGLRTTLEDFANGPESGWVSYQLTGGLTHIIRNNLVARLTGEIDHRVFASSNVEDVTEYTAGAGLTWSINRYLDVTGDISYQTTPAYDSDDIKIGAGLVLKR
jgi:hypothetical protein